jgi:transcriptional antiterminator RfaH
MAVEWAVATTVPACEHKAKADLEDAGFSCYLPRYESVEALRGQIVHRARPLFPGYLFVEFCDFWRRAFDVEYLLGMLPHGEDHPTCLPQELIDELRDREGPDGIVHFHSAKKRRYGPGAWVRVRRGPLTGYSGVGKRP